MSQIRVKGPSLDPSLREAEPEAVLDAASEALAGYFEEVGDRGGDPVGALPPAWRTLLLLIHLDGQVNNGGFHQFFTNAQGEYDARLGEASAFLEGTPAETVLKAAVDKYAGMDYLEQWENLQEAGRIAETPDGNLEESWNRFVEGGLERDFEEQDQAWYALEPRASALIGQRILERFEDFVSTGEDAFLDLVLKEPEKIEHPFLRRMNWNPLVVAVPFAYLWWSSAQRGFPLPRTAGACFVSLWFGMSVFDFFSGHRLLNWMYGDDD